MYSIISALFELTAPAEKLSKMSPIYYWDNSYYKGPNMNSLGANLYFLKLYWLSES